MSGSSETLLGLSLHRNKGKPQLVDKPKANSQHNVADNQRQKVFKSKGSDKASTAVAGLVHPKGAFFRSWTVEDVVNGMTGQPILCFFGFSLLFFMGVEYTLGMVPFNSPPMDIGFMLTQSMHTYLAARPLLNSVLAALNTVFVGMQTAYILWTFVVEGRPRSSIAALFMFTCRGIMGYATQLPLPQEFLGSGADFPVGNVSFFLFYSGHVAASIIASLDMKRMGRQRMACSFDVLNVLQALRLLASRGHYTIDLGVGVGAGYVFDILAGKYVESKIDSSDSRSQVNLVSKCKCSN